MIWPSTWYLYNDEALDEIVAGARGSSSALDRYSHWMPSIGRNTAEGIDEALG